MSNNFLQKKEISLNQLQFSDCFYDNLYLYAVLSDKNKKCIVYIIDTENFSVINECCSKDECYDINNSCMDESSVYAVSDTGDIIVIDKFSGQTITTWNIGMMFPHGKIMESSDVIHCMCSIPISKKKASSATHYSLFNINKDNGNKEVQTMSFYKEPVFSTKDKDSIFVVSGQDICRFNANDLSLLWKMASRIKIDYSTIVFNNYLVLCNKSGAIEIIDYENKDATYIDRLRTNNIMPIKGDEKLLWITSSRIYDLSNPSDIKSHEFNHGGASSCCLCNNNILFVQSNKVYLIDTNNYNVKEMCELSSDVHSIKCFNNNIVIVTTSETMHIFEKEK